MSDHETLLACRVHGTAYTFGCPGCEDAQDGNLIRERDANDTGKRIPLHDLIREQGFDPDELRAEVEAEDA